MKGTSEFNFKKAVANLERSLATPVQEPRDLSGIIKDFEMAYELSWKVLKKKLLNEGHQTLGAKDVYSQAFRLNYLLDEKPWLRMIEDRNHAAHVYDETEARKIVENIRTTYLQCFQSLIGKLP